MKAMSRAAKWSVITGLTAFLAFGGIGISASPVYAQANQVARTNVVIPLDEDVAGPDFQIYTIEGNLHVLFNVVRDSAGGLHLTGHANSQGITVTSDSAYYRLTGAANVSGNVNTVKGAASNFDAVANFGLIGRGQLTNYRLHVNIHGTINANGQVTVLFSQVDFFEH